VIHDSESLALEAEDADLVEALATFIQAEMRYLNVPGISVALGRADRLIWRGAFGFADLAQRKPMRVDSVFKSGSMAKTYTAAAVMQLVDGGVIQLSDAINELLPFSVDNPYGGEISVRHLMTHSSGLGTSMVDSCTSVVHHRPLADVLAEFVRRERDVPYASQTEPIWVAPTGRDWCYSNLGVGLLGLIVECQNPSHLSFSEYVESQIMRPLGMRLSAFPPVQAEAFLPRAISERLMTGHTVQGGVAYTAAPNYFQVPPAGAFVATASDHLLLLLALLNGGELAGRRILSESSVAQLLTPQGYVGDGYGPDGERGSFQQGLIWWLDVLRGRVQRFHHSGGHMYGFRAQSAAWPEERVAIVAASNYWPISSNYDDALPIRVANVVNAWLVEGERAEDRRRAQRHDGSRSWAWRVSYLRGARFIEVNNHALGLPDPLNIEDAMAAARSATAGGSFGADWDESAFVEGARDMMAVPASPGEIREFARSPRYKLTQCETARILWLLEGPIERRLNRSFLQTVQSQTSSLAPTN
jgi:CubicO group peptidase (beta-lactamase class C family)